MFTICALEQQNFRRRLVWKIEPLLFGVVHDLQVFRGEVFVNEISCHYIVAEIDGLGITKCQRPVVQWAAQRFPDTVILSGKFSNFPRAKKCECTHFMICQCPLKSSTARFPYMISTRRSPSRTVKSMKCYRNLMGNFKILTNMCQSSRLKCLEFLPCGYWELVMSSPDLAVEKLSRCHHKPKSKLTAKSVTLTYFAPSVSMSEVCSSGRYTDCIMSSLAKSS